jgi:hypothetical protein
MQRSLGAFQINLIVFIFGFWFVLFIGFTCFRVGDKVCIYYNTLYTKKCIA